MTALVPVQTQWVAYIGGWDVEKARAAGRAAKRDGAGGIICHLQPGTTLPGVAMFTAMQEVWRQQGHKVYLSLYLDRLGERDQDKTLAMLARSSSWDGLIVDVEAEWQGFARRQPRDAKRNLHEYVAAVRPRVPLLAYSSYALPASRSSFHFPWFDELFDLYLPQVYLGIRSNSETFDGSAKAFLDAMRASVKRAGLVKPLIPVGDPLGGGAKPAETKIEGDLSIERYGAVSWWRQPFVQKSRDAFRTLPRAIPLPIPEPSPDPCADWKQQVADYVEQADALQDELDRVNEQLAEREDRLSEIVSLATIAEEET